MDRHRPAGIWSVRWACFGAALIWAPHPRAFSRRVRSEDVSRAALATLRKQQVRAYFYPRRMGRLPDLESVPVPKGLRDGRSDFYGDDFERSTLTS